MSISKQREGSTTILGLFKRPKHVPSAQPDGNQLDVDESEVAQQPTYDTSYPAGLTVKWKDHSIIKLATVVESA
eukprot:13836206-Ditylum_brightwellii.AAC.1